MYKQFSKENRIELAVLLKTGLSKRLCARELGFNHSSVGVCCRIPYSV